MNKPTTQEMRESFNSSFKGLSMIEIAYRYAILLKRLEAAEKMPRDMHEYHRSDCRTYVDSKGIVNLKDHCTCGLSELLHDWRISDD